MLDLVRITHATKCQCKHFPFLPLFLIYLRHSEFRNCYLFPNDRVQGNTIPNNRGITRNLHGCILHCRFLVPNTTRFDDVLFLVLLPGSAHMNEFGFGIE